jgi:hypothetical protein
LARDVARKAGADPLRKIRFREAAREIVAKDRYDRKHGLPVDTAGAIARALERAYRQGFLEAQSDPSTTIEDDPLPGEAIEWVLIPPRPRAAFWTICLFILGKGEQRAGEGHLAPTITERGTPGWKLTIPAGDFRDKPFGEKTLVPLVHLGLLELAEEPPERLVVSVRGCMTWWRFLERGGEFPEDLTQI